MYKQPVKTIEPIRSRLPYSVRGYSTSTNTNTRINDRLSHPVRIGRDGASLPGFSEMFEEEKDEYLSLKDFSARFKTQYTSAVIDLAEWADSRKEKESSLESQLSPVLKLSPILRDSYQNVTSLMRVLDTDRKEAYSILHSDGELLTRIQQNRENGYSTNPKTIPEIVNSFDTEEGKRVFFKSKTNNYFGITEARKLAEQLYTKRVFEELGKDKKLVAYALNCDEKTIDTKLKDYEESVAAKRIIPFKEWEKEVKPNLEMIEYYKEKQEQDQKKSEEEGRSEQEKPKTQKPRFEDALLKIIPKPKNGKSLTHPSKSLRHRFKRAPKAPDLEDIAIFSEN